MKTNNATTATKQPRTNILVIVAGIVIALIGSLVVFQTADGKNSSGAETFGVETKSNSASLRAALAVPKFKELVNVVNILSVK